MAEENPPVWAQELLKQFANVRRSFEQKFDALNESMKSLKKDTRALINRVANAEQRISKLEDLKDTHNRTIGDLSKEVHQLKTTVTYLESQSRRNNLVFVGLKGGLFESSDPGKEMAAILRYILDLDKSDQVPEVERQHRALRPRPDPSEPPRPYIVRMLKWSDRQHILKAARARTALNWYGKPFYIFQDLPAEIQQQRAAYSDLKKKQTSFVHILSSYGSSASRGVSILIAKNISLKPLEIIPDKEGRYIIVSGTLCNKKMVLANIYIAQMLGKLIY